MATTYPAGTPVESIRHFDRSIKVSFACSNHPDVVWWSKEPDRSTWFPATTDPSGYAPDQSRCGCRGTYVTTKEYTA